MFDNDLIKTDEQPDWDEYDIDWKEMDWDKYEVKSRNKNIKLSIIIALIICNILLLCQLLFYVSTQNNLNSENYIIDDTYSVSYIEKNVKNN
jgi:hypothetical protein